MSYRISYKIYNHWRYNNQDVLKILKLMKRVINQSTNKMNRSNQYYKHKIHSMSCKINYKIYNHQKNQNQNLKKSKKLQNLMRKRNKFQLVVHIIIGNSIILLLRRMNRLIFSRKLKRNKSKGKPKKMPKCQRMLKLKCKVNLKKR